MARRTAALVARLAYGLLFVLGVPVLLIAWARLLTPHITLPQFHLPRSGLAVQLAGALLAASGWHALLMHGHGLPMNAFPPTTHVRRGSYRYLNHPIYIGFGALCFGTALFFGSAAGFWVVAPMTVLTMAALVCGYETHDLRTRFPAASRTRPLISLPEAGDEAPQPWQRASCYVLVLAPWLVLYELVQLLGIPRAAISTYLPGERALPVIEWTEAIYATPYFIVAMIPLLARTRSILREYCVLGLLATAFCTFIYVTLPLIAPPHPFTPHSWLGALLAAESAANNTVAAFPSFHVIWALLAARAIARSYPRGAAAAWLWSFAVAVACLTTGMHSLADVLAGFATYWLLLRRHALWQWLRSAAEHVANSWREWRVGPVRIINHGIYAGMGAALGVYIAGIASQAPVSFIMIVAVAAVVGAGIWAQLVEGSSVLLRPFGYYGAIFGGMAATIALAVAGADTPLLLGAFALGAPWVQAWGRVRCLVQGCCHGAPADALTGIRYQHARSRVTQLAGLRDVPLHATQLYSILWNAALGVILLRVWAAAGAPALVFGLYMMLNAIGRFVEESYRGEPQTPVVYGLRLYQWLAIASLLIGMAGTVLPAARAPDIAVWFDADYFGAALVMLVLTTAAMGLDFPDSSRRFSRLASAAPLKT